MKAVDSFSIVGQPSNVDMATTIVFTDDPLVAGVTPIKALHITELRAAVDAVRATAGLPSATFVDSITSGIFVRAVHVAELRSNLDAARSALGLSALSYTDTVLTIGDTSVKAVHLSELRAGVK